MVRIEAPAQSRKGPETATPRYLPHRVTPRAQLTVTVTDYGVVGGVKHQVSLIGSSVVSVRLKRSVASCSKYFQSTIRALVGPCGGPGAHIH